jgi:hypothetical protein
MGEHPRGLFPNRSPPRAHRRRGGLSGQRGSGHGQLRDAPRRRRMDGLVTPRRGTIGATPGQGPTLNWPAGHPCVIMERSCFARRESPSGGRGPSDHHQGTGTRACGRNSAVEIALSDGSGDPTRSETGDGAGACHRAHPKGCEPVSLVSPATCVLTTRRRASPLATGLGRLDRSFTADPIRFPSLIE